MLLVHLIHGISNRYILLLHLISLINQLVKEFWILSRLGDELIHCDHMYSMFTGDILLELMVDEHLMHNLNLLADRC